MGNVYKNKFIVWKHVYFIICNQWARSIIFGVLMIYAAYHMLQTVCIRWKCKSFIGVGHICLLKKWDSTNRTIFNTKIFMFRKFWKCNLFSIGRSLVETCTALKFWENKNNAISKQNCFGVRTQKNGVWNAQWKAISSHNFKYTFSVHILYES